MKNLCAKTRPLSNPYETWRGGDWVWKILKKYQVDDNKPFSRAFCHVTSPYCPQGELGDVYLSDIRNNAARVV